VQLLKTNATAIGLGEVFYGPSLALNFNVGGLGAGQDPRSPDILVIPNVGMTYSGSTTMIGDHGGFGHDDTNVIMLVANPNFSPQTVAATVRTAQVAPTILQALGMDAAALDAVRAEGTEPLPGVQGQLTLMSRAGTGRQ
jgi:arylsulfatase A-like enzyme